ncbi:type II secretion system protein [Candidatus Saccharibacteria bacterium]|nr:type II secretion system protein [Candidatus Saccharibacteria bacterium]MBI3337797.1 type II secretion system protein [Candidatus Saccharibacteria bacterium]
MKNKQTGFTIIELLIATLVFSVILLLATSGLLQIGRLYNKGVINSRTQEVARTIMEDISQSIQFNGGNVTPAIMSSGVAPNTSTGFCIGQRRYSMILGKEMADTSTSHGLVADTITSSCTTSVAALDLSQTSPPGANNPREFLAPFMRIAYLDVTSYGNNLYRISLRLAYGDDDLLTSLTGYTAQCKDEDGTQFCSTAELSTIIQKRVK